MKKLNLKSFIYFFALLIFVLFLGIFLKQTIQDPPEGVPETEDLQAPEPESPEPLSDVDEKDEEEQQEEVIQEDEKSSLDLNFLFFGDMMLDRYVGKRIDQRGLDYIFGPMKEQGVFDSRDLIGANLEGAVTHGGQHYPPEHLYDFAFSPEIVSGIVDDYNFNFFNIANNHLADQGDRGIEETNENLNDIGVYFSGCEDGVAGDCSLETVDFGDIEVAFLGFSMVYSIPDEDKMASLIESAASSSDLVVVNIHWGVEYEHNFNRIQRKFGQLFIDNGADMVVGHHPHVIQGMEIYNEKPIFYSLGNFVFDQYFSSATQEGFALEINIQEEEIVYSFKPFVSENSQVRMITEDSKKQDFFDNFVNWSNLDEEEEEELFSFRSISLKR